MDYNNKPCSNLTHWLEIIRFTSFFGPPEVGIIITALYVIVITVGAVGNLLVVMSVVQSPAMRTPRNVFIVNLALSDFLLCTLTVPFTMRYVLILFWDLGDVACRVVSSAQGINISVSTMSLTAIALDRYIVILFPTRRNHQRTMIAFIAVMVWGLSFLIASPCFFVTSATESLNENVTLILNNCKIEDYRVCTEKLELWNEMPMSRETYTIVFFVIQYFLPLFGLSFVYARIMCRMQARLNGPSQSASADRRRSVASRQRRTNVLLISLVVTFAAAWLPLNIYNTLIVFNIVNYRLVLFALCHIAGMVSACTNPILYGVFNENFRQEFLLIFKKLGILACLNHLKKLIWKRSDSQRGGRPTRLEDNNVVPTKQSLLSPQAVHFEERESLLSGGRVENTASFHLTPQPITMNGKVETPLNTTTVTYNEKACSVVSSPSSSSNHEIML